jgi:hypothetical protein
MKFRCIHTQGGHDSFDAVFCRELTETADRKCVDRDIHGACADERHVLTTYTLVTAHTSVRVAKCVNSR